MYIRYRRWLPPRIYECVAFTSGHSCGIPLYSPFTVFAPVSEEARDAYDRIGFYHQLYELDKWMSSCPSTRIEPCAAAHPYYDDDPNMMPPVDGATLIEEGDSDVTIRGVEIHGLHEFKDVETYVPCGFLDIRLVRGASR